MFDFVRLSGPWGIVLLALIVLNLGLAGWSLASLLGEGEKTGPPLQNRINAVLFWGAFGAVVGVLGQVHGIYLSLRVVSQATDISPPIVMEGFAISLLPAIPGFLLLLGSALAWMGLRTMHGRRLGPGLPA